MRVKVNRTLSKSCATCVFADFRRLLGASQKSKRVTLCGINGDMIHRETTCNNYKPRDDYKSNRVAADIAKEMNRMKRTTRVPRYCERTD